MLTVNHKKPTNSGDGQGPLSTLFMVAFIIVAILSDYNVIDILP